MCFPVYFNEFIVVKICIIYAVFAIILNTPTVVAISRAKYTGPFAYRKERVGVNYVSITKNERRLYIIFYLNILIENF